MRALLIPKLTYIAKLNMMKHQGQNIPMKMIQKTQKQTNVCSSQLYAKSTTRWWNQRRCKFLKFRAKGSLHCGSQGQRLYKIFFFYQGFFHRHWRFTGEQEKGGYNLLIHSTTSTHSRILIHLFATVTWWNLPPYRINIWVIDWWCNVCLFTWWINSRFLLQRFDIGNWWIWTRIDYHPCITSKQTNQVC